MRDRLKDMPPHFRTVWRPSHTKSLSNLDKNKLRAATQYLTGHCELNYHLNKYLYRPQNISKICPHCSMEEETMNHFIGQCPMWFNRRGRFWLATHLSPRARAFTCGLTSSIKGRFFNCYYTSISEVGLLLNRSPINYHVTLVFRASRVLRKPKLNPNPSL